MESRKFEALKEKITLNKVNLWMVGDLSSDQAFELLPLLKNNTSIIELIFLSIENHFLQLDVNKLILGAFCHSETLVKLKIKSNSFLRLSAPLKNFLLKNNSVTDLDLSRCDLGNEGVKIIAGTLKINTALKRLNLSYNGISHQSCWVLKQVLLENKSLTALNLRGNNLSGEAFSVLAAGLIGNQTLFHMGLRGCHLKSVDINILRQVLQKNPTLKSISIAANNDIGNLGIGYLCESLSSESNINSLYISGTHMSDEGLIPLVKKIRDAKQFKNFGCANNLIGDKGAHALADLIRNSTSLQQLFTYGCGIGFVGALDIARAMQVNQSITCLDLCGARFNNFSSYELAKALVTNKTLIELDVSECSLGDIGVSLLFDALKHHPVLKKIVMQRNQFGLFGAMAIAELLKTTEVLDSLDVTGGMLSDEVGVVLVDALTNNHSVSTLIADQNHFAIRSAAALSQMLSINTVLVDLRLADNNFRDEGFLELLRGLRHNITLRELHVLSNRITSAIADEILAAMQENYGLVKIDLHVLNFSEEFKEKFYSLIKINCKIKKWLHDYHEDMIVIYNKVNELISSKSMAPPTIILPNFSHLVFLRCMQFVFVEASLPVQQLDMLVARLFGDNELMSFYEEVKKLVVHPYHPERALYRLRFFSPPREIWESSSVEMPASNRGCDLKLSLNF